jgi:hypothetical protein
VFGVQSRASRTVTGATDADADAVDADAVDAGDGLTDRVEGPHADTVTAAMTRIETKRFTGAPDLHEERRPGATGTASSQAGLLPSLV